MHFLILCHTYKRHTRARFNENTQYFFLCMNLGKCKTVDCTLGDWGPWTGDIPADTCAVQERKKSLGVSERIQYQEKTCDGLKTSCGEAPQETRKMCMYADSLIAVIIKRLRMKKKLTKKLPNLLKYILKCLKCNNWHNRCLNSFNY